MTHQQLTDAVRAGVAPRDVYPERPHRPIPSRETQVAAVKLNAALAFLDVARHVGVAGEQAKAEFEQAKQELRACVREDLRRSQEARA